MDAHNPPSATRIAARPRIGLAALQSITALGAAGCATVGIWFRGSAGTRTVDTLYGPVELLVGGLFEGNSPALVAEGVGWDVVTLFLVVPAMLVVAALLAWRGDVRTRIVSAGLFFYCLYQYFQYGIGYAFGPLTAAFIAVAALAMVGFVWALGTVLDANPGRAYPRIAMVAVWIAIPTLLLGMWGVRIVDALPHERRQAVLLGATSMFVQVMDLVWLVPLGLFVAVLLLRRVRRGYVLATVLSVKGSAIGFAIGAMVINASFVTGQLEVVPMLLFFALGIVCIAVAVVAIRSVHEGTPTAPERIAVPERSPAP